MKPSWIPYAGPDEVLLALALGMVTAVAVFAAVGIRRPFLGPSASRGLVVMLVVAWLLAILTSWSM